jgi:hypothetical protein
MKQIISELLSRSIELRAPASLNSLSRMESELGIKIDAFSRELYQAFDGFESADPSSMMNLWSIEEILENWSDIPQRQQAVRIPIGDFLIYSDILTARLDASQHPVILTEADREVAVSLPEFFVNLIGDKLNLDRASGLK